MRHASRRWHDLRRIAADQHGLVTRRQALDAGFSSSAIAAAVARGEWRRMGIGVYALPGTPNTPLVRVAAATLGRETAAASGWTAMWLWGLRTAAPSTVELLVPHGRRAPVAARVHCTRTRTLPAADRTEVQGVPTLTVARGLVTLAARADLGTLRGLAIAARQRGDLELPALVATVERVGPVAGIGSIRRLVRQLSDSRADSVLEHEVRRRLHEAGFRPHPEPWRVDVGDRFVLLDIAFPAYRVAIEVDGFAYHSTPAQLARDHQRSNLLLDTDWSVLRVSWADVEHDFTAVLRRLEHLLRARGWQPG